MASKRYTQRKERMAVDPEFRRKLYAEQAASRARRRARQLEAVAGVVCGHAFAGGRHCWKGYPHKHGGEAVDPLRELVLRASER